MARKKAVRLEELRPVRRWLSRALCLGFAGAVLFSFPPGSAAADEVCDYLRKKIVWNYAVGQVGKAKLEGHVVLLESLSQTDAPSMARESLWLGLYADSRCSPRRLAEALIRADEMIVAQRSNSVPFDNK